MWGLGFGVWGLRFIVSGFGVWVWDLRAESFRGFRFRFGFAGSGFQVQGFEFRVRVKDFRGSGFQGFRAQGSGLAGFRVQGFGFRVQGFCLGFRVQRRLRVEG